VLVLEISIADARQTDELLYRAGNVHGAIPLARQRIEEDLGVGLIEDELHRSEKAVRTQDAGLCPG
jgi:hypothetical protein